MLTNPYEMNRKSANKVNFLPEGFSLHRYESLHWFCCYKQDFKKNQLSLLYFMFDVSHPGLSSSVSGLGNVLHHTQRMIRSEGHFASLHFIVYLNKRQQFTSEFVTMCLLWM